jgi:hypothetical protein
MKNFSLKDLTTALVLGSMNSANAFETKFKTQSTLVLSVRNILAEDVVVKEPYDETSYSIQFYETNASLKITKMTNFGRPIGAHSSPYYGHWVSSFTTTDGVNLGLEGITQNEFNELANLKKTFDARGNQCPIKFSLNSESGKILGVSVGCNKMVLP